MRRRDGVISRSLRIRSAALNAPSPGDPLASHGRDRLLYVLGAAVVVLSIGACALVWYS
jgi:hypothetical protein